MVSGGASGDDPVGERMELSNRVLTVTTRGGFIDVDLSRLRQAAKSVNDAFKNQNESALWSQRMIEKFLERELPPISAEEIEEG